MPDIAQYAVQDSIATITMDDGKRNALSQEMFTALSAGLDRAQADRAVVVLTGREGVFSAGFDLRVLGAGGEDSLRLVQTGFKLAARLLAFPMPVVIACPGHALAMGSFLLLSVDYRIGAAGPYKIGANEVSIGITMPFFGIEMCRQRLAPAHFQRAVINSEIYSPEDAVAAGFLDRTAPAAAVMDEARQYAAQLAKLNLDAHAATKLRAREQALKAINAAIETDAVTFPN